MLPSHHEGEISKSFPSSEIQRLQEQNTSLRNTIAQMRKEMETLSDQILPSAQSGRETSNTSLPDSKTAADAPTPGERGRDREEAGHGGMRKELYWVQNRSHLESYKCTSPGVNHFKA